MDGLTPTHKRKRQSYLEDSQESLQVKEPDPKERVN